jgi:hypothetical protein
MSTPVALKAKWAAAGLCINCGCRPHDFMSSYCVPCIERRYRASKRRTNQKTARRILVKHNLLTFHRRTKEAL